MNFHSLFYKEVREKKRTASGVFHRKGKRGYVGKLYLTSDYLKGKAKREYQKTSKVVTYNMYDKLVEYKEFIALDEERQKKTLEEYRKRFPNVEIMRKWGLDEYQYYTKLLKRLKIQTKPSSRRKGAEKKKALKTPSVAQIPIKEEKTKDILNNDGLTLTVTGEYIADKIQQRLEKVSNLLEEGTKYKIKVEIQEIIK